MLPYFMAGCKQRTVDLNTGELRHFRCNDPRTLAKIADRTPDVVADVRGPYKVPVKPHL
ncbi:MAG: hypothetical protein JXR07_10875 [Reichenbachiella sp.]